LRLPSRAGLPAPFELPEQEGHGALLEERQRLTDRIVLVPGKPDRLQIMKRIVASGARDSVRDAEAAPVRRDQRRQVAWLECLELFEGECRGTSASAPARPYA
jgi:hypothetical protein